VNGQPLLVLDWAALVNGVTSNIHDASQSAVANWNHNGLALIGGFGATDETLGTVHSNASHSVLAQMLLRTLVPATHVHLHISRTATSSTSFVPLFSVSMALRMAGICSVSNLTAAGVSSAFLLPSFNRALTVHDGTNDLMDLAGEGGTSARESL